MLGAGTIDHLGSNLVEAFGEDVTFLDQLPPRAHPPAALVLSVHAQDDGAGLRTFASWALAAGVPALTVMLGDEATFVGPLARPGLAGCGNCAAERMRAAAAGRRAVGGAAGPERRADRGPWLGAAVADRARDMVTLGLAGHVVALESATAEPTSHRLVPLPRCPACGGAARSPGPQPVVAADGGLAVDEGVDALLAQLAGWVDPLTGIIPHLQVEAPPDEARGLPLVITAAPPHVVEGDALRSLPVGWGKGFTLATAIASAVGEAVERYGPSVPDPDALVWARPAELQGDVLEPPALVRYAESQYGRDGFPYTRYDPSIRHPWVRGRWLGDAGSVWLPATLAFLSLAVAPEHVVAGATSNGLAASTDEEDAARRATLELVERDAFMATWMTGTAGRRVHLDGSVEPAVAAALEGLAALGATVELFALQTSVIGTTVLALGLGDGEAWPGVTLGLGTDVDGRRALRQAVLELGQTGPYLRRLLRRSGRRIPAQPSDVRDMLDHALYYFPPERAGALDFIRAGAPPLDLDDLQAPTDDRSLASWATALARSGVRVAVVDVSSADMAAGPFRVVRAMSPDLQPIYFGHGCDVLPVQRIKDKGLAQHVPDVHPIW